MSHTCEASFGVLGRGGKCRGGARETRRIHEAIKSALAAAFGRGSDESTRFGLELFGRLELQLLVVTPLQKISTIEPFVEAVGYVKNDDPVSRLLTMTISEYRETRQRHLDQRRARPGNPPAAMDADLDRGLEDGLADKLDHASGGLDPLSRVS